MHRLNEDEMQMHISVLGWLYIAANACFLLLSLVTLSILPLINTLIHDPDAISVLTFIGTAFAVVMGVLGLPGMITGYGLLNHRPWARVLALVLGVLGILNFPVGTALGLYTLWVLLQWSAEDAFIPHQPA